MTCTFYELEDDLYVKGRWHLRHLRDDQGVKFDSREFRYGQTIEQGPPLRCRLWNEDDYVEAALPFRLNWSRDGTPLDFTYTDSDMPVVTNRVAQILANIAGGDFQEFPVLVDRMDQEYQIINVTACLDCLDTDRSDIEWWEEGNDIRPDKAGLPHSVNSLFIDPNQVGDHHIFRIKNWTLPIIVSETVKKSFEQAKVSGVLFSPVS